MKQNNSKTNWKLTWILNSALLTTLIFNPNLADPFNSPKFWTLLLCTSLILGPIIEQENNFNAKDNTVYKITKKILSLFLIFALISSIFAYNKQAAFLGENFRRNGFLTLLSFSIFFIGVIKLMEFKNLDLLLKRITFMASVTGMYSLLQITNNDFVAWSDTSAVITTLGNSNFAGAAMAIFALICLGQLFVGTYSKPYRLYVLLTLLLLLFSIEKTNARQAIYIFLVGAFLIFINQVFNYSKKLSLFLISVATFFGFFAFLGMVQIGPLQDFFYKSSITIRGYYWRAGIEMFQHSPIVGVGIDNYGSFFKEFRETSYSLKYGFGITSTNAHNFFIQYFATGGFFVGILYMALQFLILKQSLVLLKNSSKNSRNKLIIIIAGWFAFQLQSIVSIDNIGLSIWGWLLGGSIIGISLERNPAMNSGTKTSNKSLELRWKPLTLSVVLVLSSLYLISDLYKGERYTILSKSYTAPDSTDQTILNLFNVYSEKALSSRFIDTDYRNIVYANMWQMGSREVSLIGLEKVHKQFPRNLDTLLLLAIGNEQIRNFDAGINYRKKIAELDPWNAQNYLALGVVYKYIGDYSHMYEIRNKILSFAKNDPIAKTAMIELAKPVA